MCGFSTPTNTRFARVTRQEEAIKEFNSAEDTTWKNYNYKEWLRCGAREQKTECANGGFNQIHWYGGERKPLFLFRLHFMDFRVRGAVVLPSHASINRNWMALHWNLVATGEWRSRISGARVWELICTFVLRPTTIIEGHGRGTCGDFNKHEQHKEFIGRIRRGNEILLIWRMIIFTISGNSLGSQGVSYTSLLDLHLI